uniref:Uncharacterized protein n=1 Tax=candidate division WOR-3 bacterium TaxID=2052148 RepID=A0A7V1EIH3_UNCW3
MGRIQFQGFSPLMMFCAIVIAGLCFGQFIKPSIVPSQSHPELVSWSHIGQYVKPLSQWDKLTMSNFQTHTSQFFNTTLIMQAECDSLQPKTSFWKQAGIYGLEFAGAGVSATVCAVIATISIMEEGDVENWRPEHWPFVYVSGNLLITSSCTWGIGELLGQKGAWWKTAIGAGVGGIAGSVIIMIDEKDRRSNDLLWLVALSSTALGSVVGFNF